MEHRGRRHAGDDLAGDADIHEHRLAGKDDVGRLPVGRLHVRPASRDPLQGRDHRGVPARGRPPVNLDDVGPRRAQVLGEGGETEVHDRQAAPKERGDGLDVQRLVHAAPAFPERSFSLSRSFVASREAWWFEGMTTQPAASSFAVWSARFCGSLSVPVIEASTGR